MFVCGFGTSVNLMVKGGGFEHGCGVPLIWYRWSDYSGSAYYPIAFVVDLAVVIGAGCCVGIVVEIALRVLARRYGQRES